MAASAGRRRAPWDAFNLRTFKYGSHASLFTLIVLAITIILYAITVNHSQRIDVTRAKRFTLASQSVKLLQTLEKPIKVMGFFRFEGPERGQFEDLLQQYVHHSEQITYEVVDPDRQLALAKRYNITPFNAMVVTGYDKEEKVFRLEEEALTNAILTVIREKKKVIYFTTGHGEPSITDTERNGYSLAKQGLENQNYDVKELVLVRHERLPDDAAVVVVAGLQTDLLQPEIGALAAYIEGGGHVLIMLDPEVAAGLVSFLARYGLTLGHDWVIETNALGRLFGGDYHMPAVTAYAGHPITEDLSVSGVMTIFPVARSVRIAELLPDGVSAQTLMSTSPQSWAETDLEALEDNRSAFDEGRDQKGPISIAAVATVAAKQVEGTEESTQRAPAARLVVIGDSEYATNNFITLQGNGDFFLNAVSWLAEEEDLIAIGPREGGRNGPVILTAAQEPLIFWLPVVVLPLAVFTAGALVFSRRRWQQ